MAREADGSANVFLALACASVFFFHFQSSSAVGSMFGNRIYTLYATEHMMSTVQQRLNFYFSHGKSCRSTPCCQAYMIKSGCSCCHTVP